jgi:hypothetical protein
VEALESRDLLATLNLPSQAVLVAEGNYGLNTAQFTVSLSSPSTQTITTDYATSDGSAVDGVDYTRTTGTLTFQPGETSKSISVPILSNHVDQLNGTFTVTLSNPQGPTGTALGTAQALGVILDDVAPSLWVESPTVAEGAGAVNVMVHLTDAYTQPVTVYCTTSDNSASGPLTFQPGQTVVSFPVSLPPDNGVPGPTRTFTLTVSAADGRLLATDRNHNFLYRLYSDALQRPADSAGLASLTAALNLGTLTRLQVASGMLTWNEYRGKVVVGYYTGYLRRQPTAVEVSAWLANYPGQEALQVSVLSTLEYYARAGGSSGGFIKALFKDVLNRDASPGAIATWQAKMAAGMTRGDVASQIVRGDEARGLVIDQLYQSLLRKTPTSLERTNSLNQLKAGGSNGVEAVKATLLGSAGYNNTALGSPATGTITVLDADSTVSVQATTASAAEGGSAPGKFTVTRSGDTSADLPVWFTLRARRGAAPTTSPCLASWRSRPGPPQPRSPSALWTTPSPRGRGR